MILANKRIREVLNSLLFMVVLTAMNSAYAQPPNILIVLVDDFGTGHFAPVAKQLELNEVDPDRIQETLLVDPSRCVYHSGRWMEQPRQATNPP